jgi:type II secretory pathway pseudopilin PulG
MRRNQLGVSLVEALVAMAVMAFGMLAIVGVQSTMRQNSDIAKQRSEAVRIAQEAMEQWRSYSVLDATAGRVAYADIVDPPADVPVAGYTTNTTYTLERKVVAIAGQNHKVLRVRVSWLDRTSAGATPIPNTVTLNSVIGLIDPAVTAALITPPAGNPNRRPFNRHAAIPLNAQEMGGGLSAFKPPVPGGGGTVAWVFNNISGMIVGVCTVSAGTVPLTRADIASCSDNTLAHLVSGYVRFHDGSTQPTAADARAPTGHARNLDMDLFVDSVPAPPGPTVCFDDAPETPGQAALQTAVAYYCLVPARTTPVRLARTWSGYLTIKPLAFTDETTWTIPTVTSPSVSSHLLCRYTPAANDSVIVSNPLHPRLYRVEFADPLTQLVPIPMPPLPNQNFLVIEAGLNCPTDTPPDPATGHFVNGNTLLHLPWPP